MSLSNESGVFSEDSGEFRLSNEFVNRGFIVMYDDESVEELGILIENEPIVIEDDGIIHIEDSPDNVVIVVDDNEEAMEAEDIPNAMEGENIPNAEPFRIEEDEEPIVIEDDENIPIEDRPDDVVVVIDDNEEAMEAEDIPNAMEGENIPNAQPFRIEEDEEPIVIEDDENIPIEDRPDDVVVVIDDKEEAREAEDIPNAQPFLIEEDEEGQAQMIPCPLARARQFNMSGSVQEIVMELLREDLQRQNRRPIERSRDLFEGYEDEEDYIPCAQPRED